MPLKNQRKESAIVAHTFSPSAEEAETHKSLQDQGQKGLHSEFQATQGCIVRHSPAPHPRLKQNRTKSVGKILTSSLYS